MFDRGSIIIWMVTPAFMLHFISGNGTAVGVAAVTLVTYAHSTVVWGLENIFREKNAACAFVYSWSHGDSTSQCKGLLPPIKQPPIALQLTISPG